MNSQIKMLIMKKHVQFEISKSESVAIICRIADRCFVELPEVNSPGG